MVGGGGCTLSYIAIPSLKLHTIEPVGFFEVSPGLGSMPESVLRPIQLALFDFSLSCPSETTQGRNAWFHSD